ncbi:hypothetical protein [Exiguobacterium sp. s130]|uniref:hypothetical protein n=1 Tax=Exiguobacterium sp. s130 TaxID=2751190 RepID=UPI001BEB5F8E|nr:hypothetical protein [Exiguobacterium sp. s130]
MQEKLVELRLSKAQRKAAAKHLKEYFTLPSRIESKKAMAEAAATKMTPGYHPSEVQTNQAPSSKIERYTMVMSEVAYLEKRYALLHTIYSTQIDEQQRELWDLLYDPRYYRSDEGVMRDMHIGTRKQYYRIKHKLLVRIHEHFGEEY